MPARASSIGSLARPVLVSGLIALLVGLPVAVDVNTTLDSIHGVSGLGPRANGVVLADPLPVVAVPGLVLQSAYVTALDGIAPVGDTTRAFLLEGARLTIDVGSATARGKPAAPAQDGALQARLSSLDVDAVLLRHAEVEIRRPDAGSWLLTDVTAEIGGARKGGRSLSGIASYAGQRLKFAVEWKGETRPGLTPLKMRVESNLADIRFDGHLETESRPGLAGEARLEARKLRAFARWLGVPTDTSNDLLDAQIAGPMAWRDGVISFDRASVRVDGNEGAGSIVLKTGGARPAIDGTLGFDKFDVSRYIASLMSPPASDIVRPAGARPLLAVIDADLRLSAGKVVSPSLETGRAALTVVLRDGRLKADLAELEIERGRATGQLAIDVAEHDVHRLVVKGRISDVDPGRAFATHLKRNPLFGRAHVAVDLTGSGTSLPAILAGISGRGMFTLAEGGKLALDLRTLLHAAQATQIVGWSAAGKGSTNLETLEGRFSIANGGLTIDTLAARGGGTSWQGTGKVDLTEQLLDLILTQGPAGQDAAQSVRDALAIRGTWFDPAISLLRQPAVPTGSLGPMLPAPGGQLRN